MRRRDVAAALEPWTMQPKKVKRVRAVFKVYTAEGVFCLKPTGESEKRLRFFASVLRHVKAQGFEKLAAYLQTRDGECFANLAGQTLLLTPWIDGKEIDYRSTADICAAAKLLGEFHRATEGYVPEAGIKVKDRSGRLPDKLARQAGDIDYYRKLAEQGSTDFDRYFLQHAEWLWKRTLGAFTAIRESSYYRQVEESREVVQICHGDPSKRNFIKQNGQMYMIDFESMKADLPVVDLWRLLRRTASREQWDLRVVKPIITAYNSGRKMCREEYELLGILLGFPEKVWRVVHTYYEKRNRADWSEVKLYHQLRKLLKQSEEMDQFIAEYQKEFMGE